MKRTTASLLTGALAAGTFAVLATAAPGIASASGCGTTTLDENTFPAKFSIDGSLMGGVSEIVDGGLHVKTTAPDQKANRVYPVDRVPLASQTAESNYGYEYDTATGLGPGYNLLIDLDGNAATPGYVTLVKENGLYGGEWWNNSAAVKGVEPGLGYAHLGTIQEYSDANPDAQILGFAYSLGRGPSGDAVIRSITFGCNTFAFDLANRAPVADIAEPVDEADASYRSFWFDGSGSTDPDGDINLAYSWNFGDGSAAQTGAQVSHVFPKGKKSYTVTLTVTDPSGLSSTDTVTVNVTPPTNTVGGPLADTGADVKGLAALGGLVAVGSAAGLVANRRRKGADA
ncbi:PKD domain-containing protein [Blastococcus fimeti]|nr:PKD domain-containing protein [Blastococcus fimeti]